MDPTRPETISFWSLDLRVRDPHPEAGDIRVTDANVNDLITLAYMRWEWQAPRLYDLSPSRSGAPVVPVLDRVETPVAIGLSMIGDKDIVVRGDRIVFRNSGLEGTVEGGASGRIMTEPVDGTENISLTATVAGIVHDASKQARPLPSDSTRVPVAAFQPFEETGTMLRLDTFASIQPLFYLEQAVGFVLLAEVFQSPEERRLVYTLRPVTDDGGVEAADAPPSIDSAQVKATTPAFRLADSGALHTIRAHQDGNLGAKQGGHRGYLEFWVNGLPLGVRLLSDARFRFRGGPAKLTIGAWPRRDETLYLTGEIVHINFDPINKCTPC